MCLGYEKEISAWVRDEARSQREVMMNPARQTGIVTLCIGGGQGIALALEVL